jgi:tetratricopeptide (TPR) repeat protein
MRRAIILLVLLFLAFSFSVYGAKDYTLFNKGVAYILIGDKEMAVSQIENFFQVFPDPALRSAFVNLIEDNSMEVAREFKRYLDINHRSSPALVGIALSTTNMEDSTSIGNLQRAIRLTPGFAPAYLCLGYEYMKIKNYPRAEANFLRAIRLSNVPEFKILLCQLRLVQDDPGAVLSLMKPIADRQPDGFYFNYYTAKAYYHLNQLEEMGKYIEAAIEVNPRNNDAQLLLGQYLLSQGDLKRAKTVLKKVRFSKYNEDYFKTLGHVLLKLKDRQTKGYLDEVYSRKKWDKDINRLLGLYYVWKKGTGNVQNWINRALLSGYDEQQLRQQFPGNYTFPQYKNLPFFNVTAIHWLSADMLLAAAVKRSGDRELLYLIRLEDLKVMDTLSYQGDFQDIFFSGDRKRMVFSTVAMENESVHLYGIEDTGRKFVIRPLYNRPLKMASAVAGFNRAGNMAYITNRDIEARAFESPFSISADLGQKKYVYPDYPYPIFKYNFVSHSLSALKDIEQMAIVPIDCVKKYFTIMDAYDRNSSVQRLVENGLRLELTSSKVIKIYFSTEISSFVIYLSDLTNAFQAQLIDNINNRVFKVDETMFLGEGQYAELELQDFDPEKKELVVVTKDKERNLIKFSYETFLYTRLADKVMELHYDKENGIFYVLTERSKKRHFTSTNLAVIYLDPYHKKIVDERRDLNRILSVKNEEVYFSTNDGEIVKMDPEYKFHYIGPSYEGCLYSPSSSGSKTAAFINDKLFIVDRIETDMLEKWASDKNSKK